MAGLNESLSKSIKVFLNQDFKYYLKPRDNKKFFIAGVICILLGALWPSSCDQSSKSTFSTSPAKKDSNIRNASAKMAKTSDEGLSDEYIVKVLNSQQELLNRCYFKRTSTSGVKSGLVKINFTIQTSGKSTNVSITESQFNDENLHKCLRDVISRVSFKAFRGKPISTQFPIRFTE